ncbi:MAG: hypothetical protein Phog2KO_11160 [Phototrophicaceae bacterium]
MEKQEIRDYAQEVAKILGENDEQPVSQIEQLVEHLGRDFVQEQLEETQKIEEKGGLKTDDNKRRRTMGGVFFYLVKGKMDESIRQKIFPNFGKTEKAKSLTWEERQDYVDDLIDEAEHGAMRHVMITLQGRPGKTIIEGNSVITTISHTHKESPYPKGVPQPPEETMVYTVYIGIRQWNGVIAELEEYQGDSLVVEGSLFWDADTETIAVFAQAVTTRRLQKQARRASEKKAPPPTKAEAKKVEAEEKPKVTASSKLEKLYAAAETLRERIADMEAKGKGGVAMTKKLLKNTEKQIATLEKHQAK